MSSKGIVVVQCVCVCQRCGNYNANFINYKNNDYCFLYSNDNGNCNAILRLEGNGNGNWYRE